MDHCSFEVPRAAICGLIGPNGSGKSTIFNLVTGFLQPTEGRVFFKDNEITGLQPHEITQLGIARTFQMVRVFRRMTVMENLLLAPETSGRRELPGRHAADPGVRRQESQNLRQALDLLAVVGLARIANEYCGNLSYAEQKMVEITRALMTDPDSHHAGRADFGHQPDAGEPDPGLHPQAARRAGQDVLIVEHDMRVIMNLCDRIAVLNYGEKIAEGTPAEISANRARDRRLPGRIGSAVTHD